MDLDEVLAELKDELDEDIRELTQKKKGIKMD